MITPQAVIHDMVSNAPPVNSADLLEWQKPDVTLLNEGNHPAPALPIELFGSRWSEWIVQAAECKSCPPDFVATILLGIVAGMIGDTRRAMPWDGWIEPTILWTVLVGNPSTGKTPALDTVLSAVQDLESSLSTGYKEKLRSYEAEKEAAIIRHEYWKKEVASAVDAGKTPPAIPLDAQIPEVPVRQRHIITDATIEKVAQLLSSRHRGLTLVKDELSGLITNFERRGGSDRHFYLEAYNGRSFTVDRVKHPEPLLVPYNSINMIGGIQPDKLSSLLLSAGDDGFAARMLYTWPNNLSSFSIPSTTEDSAFIQQAIQRLGNLAMRTCENGMLAPCILPFTQKAVNIMGEWRNELIQYESAEAGLLVSHIGKMPGMAVRISLVLAYMDWLALNVTVAEPSQIEEEHLIRAIRLLERYFLPMARRCIGNAGISKEQSNAYLLARWINTHKPTTINVSKLKRMADKPIKDGKQLETAIAELCECGWLKPVPKRAGYNPGRQSKDYAVNPLLWESAS